MGDFYKYAIVRLSPDDSRDERINIGVAVFDATGLDVRIAQRLENVRVISSAVDPNSLRDLAERLRDIDRRMSLSAGLAVDARALAISRLGPLSLSTLGTFSAENADVYEARIASIMRSLIEPEVAPPKVREKRSRLLTQVKMQFRRDRVLARKDEDLSSHRIVSSYLVEQGLVADLVLKNGAMHVVETVDATGDEDTFRRAIGEIGIAALVLERARMKFGEGNTKARLVYNTSASLESMARPSLEAAEHQGAVLTNWASADDQRRFVLSLSSLATPIEPKRRTRTGDNIPQHRLFN